MVDVRPFRGVRYDRQSVGDLSAVICPAYDVITPRMGDELYSRSQYNFVRLEQGRQLPQDTSSENKYTRSADTLEQWLEMGVLRADREPAIYTRGSGTAAAASSPPSGWRSGIRGLSAPTRPYRESLWETASACCGRSTPTPARYWPSTMIRGSDCHRCFTLRSRASPSSPPARGGAHRLGYHRARDYSRYIRRPGPAASLHRRRAPPLRERPQLPPREDVVLAAGVRGG